MAHIVDELVCVGGTLTECARSHTGGRSALRNRAGQSAGEHRLGDTGHRHAEIESGLHRPSARALLLGFVDDQVDERLTGLGIHLTQHLGGDLDQEAVQVAGVPLGEHLCDLRRGQAEGVAQQLVGLADELHIGILDAVVHHLHEVARAVGADMSAARHTVDMCGDLLQQRSQRFVGLLRAAGHDRRSVERALLATGDTGADEVQSTLRHGLLAPDGIGVERITAVDDDVAGLHRIGEFIDHRVGGLAGFHHDEHSAGALEGSEELPDGLRADEIAIAAVLGQKRVSLGHRPVVQGHGVTVPGEVTGDIGTHDSQTGDSDVSGGFRCGAHEAPFNVVPQRF